MTRPLTIISSLLIFWCWNLLFLFSGLMFVPDLIRHDVSWDFWLGFASLLVIPAGSLFYGVRNFNLPVKLLRYFYTFEAPLQMLVMMRIFLVREMTPALGACVAVLLTGVAAQTLALRSGAGGEQGEDPQAPSVPGAMLGAAAGGWILLVGLWCGALTGLVAIPSIPPVLEGMADLAEAFFSFDWLRWERGMSFLLYVPMILLSFAWTSTLFLTLPFAFTALSVQNGLRLRRAAEAGIGPWAAWMLCLLPILILPVALRPGAPQPNEGVMARLAEADTPAERAALLDDREAIRLGLIDAALARYRYWGGMDDSNAVSRYWEESFSLDRGGGGWAQTLFNSLCFPLIYRGDWRSDPEAARDAYQAFFDAPFEEAERAALRHALNATWERDEAKAGLLDIDEEKVLLVEQRLRSETAGPVATVVLDEVYQNQTEQVEEIQISFSMPESAALTGLWLSDDPADPTRFSPVLAPRGAAQQVYDNSRSRGRDPAILEQVGPRQYRLRVFPIPALTFTERETGQKNADKVYLRMRWSALPDAQGIPLPAELERRNLYWDASTLRTVDGQPVTADAWMPDRFGPVTLGTAPLAARLPDTAGSAWQVTATPADPADLRLPAGQDVLVGIDGSLSMAAHSAPLAAELDWLIHNLEPANRVQLARVNADGSVTPLPDDWRPGSPAADGSSAFYGSLHAQQALTALAALPRPSILLYLTDDGAYKAAKDLPIPASLPPFWFVHIGGKLPIGYPDAVADRLYIDGGVATSASEALSRLAPAADGAVRLDGWTWKVGAAEAADGADAPFAPLAARRLVAHLARDKAEIPLDDRDQMNAVAARFSAVTPWTTLLVLVEDWQREQLKQLSKADDRFDREADDGSQFVGNPGSPLVSSVPEPETWLLVGIAGMMVMYKRGAARQGHEGTKDTKEVWVTAGLLRGRDRG